MSAALERLWTAAPLAIPALFFVAVYRLLRSDGDRTAALLSAAVVWGVVLTAITEVLSLFDALGQQWLSVSWSAATVSVVLLAMWMRPRPDNGLRWSLPKWTFAGVAMLLPIAAVVMTTGFIALVGWPSQSDSMTYHWSRVDHWLQNRSVAFYPTNIPRQLCDPPWAEFAILNLATLGGDDRFGNLVQWLSMVGSLMGIRTIALRLGARPLAALFGAFFCATLPMGILQASGTQNDYVSAFWLVCLIETLLRPPTSLSATRTWRTLQLGAALGLAVLAKGTTYIFAPPFLVAFLFAQPMPRWERVRQIVLVAAVALLLNATHYARNLALFGSPLGPHDWVGLLSNDAVSPAIVLSNFVRNVSLHLGTPFPAVNAVLERVIERLHVWIGVDVADSRSTFLFASTGFEVFGRLVDPDRSGNPVHMLLVLATFPLTALSRRFGGSTQLGRYALALVMALALFGAALKWQPWHSRLQLPLFVAASPVVAIVAGQIGTAMMIVGTVFMAVAAVPPLTANRLAPLLGHRNVWNLPRTDQYFRASPFQTAYVGAADYVRSTGCSDVGLLLDWDDWEHPLWRLPGDAWPIGRRIEHVGVPNPSAGLAARRPPFTPCAIIVGRSQVADSTEIAGLVYRVTWSRDFLRVFLPATLESPTRRGRS